MNHDAIFIWITSFAATLVLLWLCYPYASRWAARLQAGLTWLRTTFIYDEMADVRDFHKRFGLLQHRELGHLSRRKLYERFEFLQEELNEFHKASERQDLEGQLDALIDLVYVAKGTAVMLGTPWHLHWKEVHRANMRKVRGITQRGHAVDVRKPEGWLPPDHQLIMNLCGYRVEEWKGEGNPIAGSPDHQYPDFCLPGRARDDGCYQRNPDVFLDGSQP